LSTYPKKIEAARHCPIPENKKQVKSALGFFGYYRKYIRNFGTIAHPLTEITKQNIDFDWGQEQENGSFHPNSNFFVAEKIETDDFFYSVFLMH
jgi:hypothetical protein